MQTKKESVVSNNIKCVRQLILLKNKEEQVFSLLVDKNGCFDLADDPKPIKKSLIHLLIKDKKFKLKEIDCLDGSVKELVLSTLSALNKIANELLVLEKGREILPIDRKEAETLLFGRERGEFLLREELFAKDFQEKWNLENPQSAQIRTLTLSYVKPDGGLGERMVVQKIVEKLWLLFDDDLSLESSQTFSSLDALLSAFLSSIR